MGTSCIKPEKLIRNIPHQTISYLCVKQRGMLLRPAGLMMLSCQLQQTEQPSMLKRHFSPHLKYLIKLCDFEALFQHRPPAGAEAHQESQTPWPALPLYHSNPNTTCSPELTQMQTAQKSLLPIQLGLIIRAHLTGPNRGPSAFFFPFP